MIYHDNGRMIGHNNVLTTVPVQRAESAASAVDAVLPAQELQGWAQVSGTRQLVRLQAQASARQLGASCSCCSWELLQAAVFVLVKEFARVLLAVAFFALGV